MKTKFAQLVAILTIAAVAKTIAGPIPLSQTELNWPFVIYAGDYYGAYNNVNDARKARGLSELVEDPRLAEAGRRLIDHMLREDWVGTNFPSGYALKNALSEAGYPVKSTVRAVVRVANDYNYLGLFGDSDALKTDSAAKACTPANGFNPNLRAFGYYIVKPLSDGGRVFTNTPSTPSNGGGSYEVMLFGSDLPVTPMRPLVDFTADSTKYNNSNGPSIVVTANTRHRLRRGIKGFTGKLSTNYFTGQAVLNGRLPKGLKFDPVLGQFYGKPKATGRFRVRIGANYKGRTALTWGADAGYKTSTFIIRIRK